MNVSASRTISPVVRLTLSAFLGLATGYSAYFLIFQTMPIDGFFRLVIVAAIVMGTAGVFWVFQANFRPDRVRLTAIFALFILLNLIVAARFSPADLPYTIPLLRFEEIALARGFSSLGLHRALNFTALELALLALVLLFFMLIERVDRKKSPGPPRSSRPANAIRPIYLAAAFPLLVYAFKIRPIIFNDDWCQIIQPIQNQNFQYFILESRRPLHLSVHWVVSKLLPVELIVSGFQLTYLLVLILSAVLTYRLLVELTHGNRVTGALGALLWVVYPNNFTHFYLSVLGIQFAYLLMLIGWCWMIRYMRSGSLRYAVLAAALNVLGFGIYEGQLGLIVVWPVVLIILLRDVPWRERLSGIGVYLSSAVLSVVWRLAIQPLFYTDSKLSSLEIDLFEIIRGYILGIQMILRGFRFPYQDPSWATPMNLALSILVIAFLGSAYLHVFRPWIAASEPASEKPASRSNRILRQLASGAILWSAGYLPVMLNYSPNIWGHLSRVNIFSILGAILMISALLNLFFSGLLSSRRTARTVHSLVFLAMIALGAIVQIQVQESFSHSWDQTRQFYYRLFTEVPGVGPQTRFAFVFSDGGDARTPHRPIFTFPWETNCALSALYNQPGITAVVRYPDLGVPSYPENVVLGGPIEQDSTEKLLSADNLIGVRYHLETGELRIIDEISAFFPDLSDEAYAPQDLIDNSDSDMEPDSHVWIR